MKSIVVKIVLSIILFMAGGYAFGSLNNAEMLYVGNAAVSQLSNSDSGYFGFLATQGGFRFARTALGIVSLLCFLGIWATTITKLWKTEADKLAVLVIASLASGALLVPNNAFAYYDTTNRGEFIEIGANQSAFLIPMVGANKSSQAQFGSEEYLNSNKVAVKRVEIPHVQANNTGALKDYYIPAAKLYLLDRTPVNREWTGSTTKGTSVKDESFHFESADSLSIHTGITMSAYVTEANAAKFFYWFGAHGQQQTQDPQIMFASVVYGRSLAEVIDTVVRAQVQATLSKEFGSRPLDQGIRDKAKIIDAVVAAVKAEFEPKGITISTVGYAEDLTFDKEIQSIMNENYIAQRKLANKDAYQVSLDISARQADIFVKTSEGMAIQKWNGTITMPSFMMISETFMHAISGWFGDKTAPVAGK